MSTCADVGSVIESKKSVVQTSNVGFTSEVSDYLVVHTGPDVSHDWLTRRGVVGRGRGEGGGETLLTYAPTEETSV